MSDNKQKIENFNNKGNVTAYKSGFKSAVRSFVNDAKLKGGDSGKVFKNVASGLGLYVLPGTLALPLAVNDQHMFVAGLCSVAIVIGLSRAAGSALKEGTKELIYKGNKFVKSLKTKTR